MRMPAAASVVMILLFATFSSGQQTTSHKWRIALTSAGAGAGFAAGAFAGLTLFDDDINSDRAVWTAALLGSGSGVVGGYFIGRRLDGRNKRIVISPILSKQAKGVRFTLVLTRPGRAG